MALRLAGMSGVSVFRRDRRRGVDSAKRWPVRRVTLLALAVFAGGLAAVPALIVADGPSTAWAAQSSTDPANAEDICDGAGSVFNERPADEPDTYKNVWVEGDKTASLQVIAVVTPANYWGRPYASEFVRVQVLDPTGAVLNTWDFKQGGYTAAHGSNDFTPVTYTSSPPWVFNPPADGEYSIRTTRVPNEGGPYGLLHNAGSTWTVAVTVSGGSDGPSCLAKELEESDTDNAGQPNDCGAHPDAADPVNVIQGNFWQTWADMVIPGHGPGLAMGRTYSSSRSATDGPLGFGWSFSYGMSLAVANGVARVRQENGAVLPFLSTSLGWLAPARVNATLVEDTGSSTARWVLRRRGTEVFKFDSSGKLTSIADLSGNTTALAYSGGLLSTVTDAANRTLTFTWSGGRVSRVTAPPTVLKTGGSSQVMEVAYGYTNGDLTSVTETDGGSWGYAYSSHRLTKVTEPRHYPLGGAAPVVENSYNATTGKVDWQRDRLGRQTTFTYNANSTTVTDPKGNAVVYEHTDGICTAVVRNPGASESRWSFEVNTSTLGRTKVTDPNGTVATAAYNHRGLATKVTTPKGTTEITYDPVTMVPTTVKDPSGVPTTYTYNPGTDQLTGVSRPVVPGTGTWAVSLAYGAPAPAGLPKSLTDERGKTWQFGYNSNGDLASITDPTTTPAARVTTWTYNSHGWPLSSVAPAGNASGGSSSQHTTSWEYNRAGEVLKVTDPLGALTEYVRDLSGYPTSVKDPVPVGDPVEQTDLIWNAAGELTTVTRPGGSPLTTTYWPDGSLKEQQDPTGAPTAYAYDAQGRLSTITDPATRVTTYRYDPAGRVVSKQQPGGDCLATSKVACISYGYSPSGELQSVDYSDAATSDVTFTYDALGRRTSMVEATGSVTSTWAWDSLGRLLSFTDPTGTVGYGYEGTSGLIASITYPGDKTVTQGFDPAGRLESLTPWTGGAVGFGYDANTNLETVNTTATTGVEDTSVFDRANRMTGYTLRQGTTALATIGYTRDPEGMVRTTSGTGIPNPTDTFGYGGFDMLASNTAGTYLYDAADNLTGFPDGRRQKFNVANDLCYQATTNTADCGSAPTGATTFAYDSRGNRIRSSPPGQAPQALVYDQADRLISSEGTANGGELTTVPVAKLLDTRATSLAGVCIPSPCSTFTAGETKGVQVTGQAGVPASGVGSVMLNVHTINGSTAGWVRINRAPGGQLPAAGMVHIDPNEPNNVSVIAKVDAQGQISVQADQIVDVRITVSGWYATSDGTSGSTYTAVAPARIVDTRPSNLVGTCTPSPCARLNVGSTVNMKVTGVGGVPATGVSAVYVNVLAASPSATGVVQVNPQGFQAEAAIAIDGTSPNAGTAIAKVATDGTIAIYTTTSTHIVIDISGWFGESGAAEFVPLDAARAVDTRLWTKEGACNPSPCAAIPAGSGMSFQATGRAGVPAANVSAVVLNFNVESSGTGSVRVDWNPWTGQSNAMFHTDGTGSRDSGVVIAVPDANGNINLTAFGTGNYDVFADVVGYFTVPPATTYTYSGDGLRRTKTASNGTVTTFTWDRARGLPLLLAEAIDAPGGATNDKTVRYIYGPDGLVTADITQPATGGSEALRWYHHDQLGSTRALTDTSGTVLATYTYSPHGQLTASTGTATTPIGWAGEYKDTETGYVYLRARYYDPNTAQFLTRDPLEAITRSAYGYAGNDPINTIDPTGMCPFCVAFVVGAVVGGGLDLGFQALGNVADGCGAFSDIDWGSVAFNGLLGGGLSVGGAWLGSGRAWSALRNVNWADDTGAIGRAASRFTADQDALIQLAKGAQRTGVDATDARTLLRWADEVGLTRRGPEIHPGRPFGQFPHIHIGPIRHIRVF